MKPIITMKKHLLDFKVEENIRLTNAYALLKLTPADGSELPEMLPGQFVQVAVDRSKATFLRRPISINNVENNRLWLLIRNAGEGTEHLIASKQGDVLNLLLPLGNGFPTDSVKGKILLVGGGVGIAPLVYLGRTLKASGLDVEFMTGARSKNDLLMIDLMREIGPVHISTYDGSEGDCGVVTLNHAWNNDWARICCCGPAPMMKAVAAIARQRQIECYVSLENMMACGLGACLCCVEKTVKGNVCVCTEGPVFNINQLTWHD